MKKLIVFLSFTFVFGLTQTQINILKIAYNLGKKYKAIDGHTFDDTICAIILTESSAGKYIIGDNYFNNGKEKHLLLKSLGVGQVKLETAMLMIKKYPYIFKNYLYLLHKNQFAYKKYTVYLQNIAYFQHLIKKYRYKKDKRSKRVYKWAKRELRKNKKLMKKYKKYYYLDMELAELLLSDISFNIKISLLYLITNYNEAIKRKMWNPYFKTISKYNGGWSNVKYYRKVMKNMKIWRKVKKNNELF